MKYFWCAFFIFWPIVAVAACAVAPAMNWWFPGEPASPLGRQIDGLFYLILIITTAVFIGTHVALGYVLIRGARETDERALFTHGSHNLEVIWTIVPAGILLFIALYQLDVWAQYRVKSQFPEEAQNAPIAEVTARQFEWRIRYPAPGNDFRDEHGRFRQELVDEWLDNPQPGDLYTVNDLHCPTNRPVLIYLRSGDVQHSIFVPDLRVKQDAVPGLVIPVWWEVEQGKQYPMLCAELCGWGHYKMEAQVWAQSEAEFEDYLQNLHTEQFDDGVSESEVSDTSE